MQFFRIFWSKNGFLTQCALAHTDKWRKTMTHSFLLSDSSLFTLSYFSGLCQMMKLKSKATPISLSWSESVSSLATNSSTWSILSSSEGDNSITGSSSVMLKRPRQVCCALLSDNPVKEPNPDATDNQEVKQFPLFWRIFKRFLK